MTYITLSNALNNSANVAKTIASSADNPFSFGDTVFDDLQGQVSGGKLPASNTPTWENITLGGIVFKALSFAQDDYIDFFIQTNHSTKLSTEIDDHIHWTLAADDNGKKFRFQVTGVGAGIGAAFASIGTITSSDVTLNANAGKHNYLEIGHIPGTINTTVSSLFIVRLTRIVPDDADNATSRKVYVLFHDNHVEIDRFGSKTETSQ